MSFDQYPVIYWLINLVAGADAGDSLNQPFIFGLLIFGAIVLVLMTVSFLFKFILKLVDR